MKDERRSLQLDGIEGVGLSLVSHGGTGVFVVIAGIEVAEKRGRHWVRLPWCCKARVVDVVEQDSQNLLNSQDLQNCLRGSEDSPNQELDVRDCPKSACDLEVDGMALEFKELRRELAVFEEEGGFGFDFWDGLRFVILKRFGWIGLGP